MRVRRRSLVPSLRSCAKPRALPTLIAGPGALEYTNRATRCNNLSQLTSALRPDQLPIHRPTYIIPLTRERPFPHNRAPPPARRCPRSPRRAPDRPQQQRQHLALLRHLPHGRRLPRNYWAAPLWLARAPGPPGHSPHHLHRPLGLASRRGSRATTPCHAYPLARGPPLAYASRPPPRRFDVRTRRPLGHPHRRLDHPRHPDVAAGRRRFRPHSPPARNVPSPRSRLRPDV